MKLSPDPRTSQFVDRSRHHRTTATRTTATRTTATRTTATRTTATRTTATRTTATRAAATRTTATRTTATRTAATRTAATRDGGNQDGGNQDGGNQDDGNQDDGNQDDGNQDDSNQDDSNQDDGNQGDSNQGGGNQDGGNEGGGNQGATPTVTPTSDTQQPPPPPQDGNNQDATPTAKPTIVPNEPTATPTAAPTATPTDDGNGGTNGNGNQQYNPGNNQGRSDNPGGNNQGYVVVKSFISNPTPLPQSSQPQTQTPIAITVPELLNVRTGPGLTYDIVTTVPAGTQATIVGIAPDGDWYQVEIDGIEGQVWIYQDLTTLVGSLTGVKQYTALEIAQLTGTPGADGAVPLAITVPITMNVRTGPGLTYDVVRIVPKGTQGRIYGIDPDNDWFQIELEGLDTLVWVYQDLTTVIGSLAGVKWVTLEELALLPAAITQPLLLNARAGPGLAYDILTTIPQGTWMKITGIDPLGEWYRVELYDLDQPAWIFRDYTKVAGGTLSGLIQLAFGGSSSPTAGLLTGSITVELSLPQAGGVDLEVSWLDVSACAQLYNLYPPRQHRHDHLHIVGAGGHRLDHKLKESEFQHPEREQLHLGLVRDESSWSRGCRSRDRSRRGRRLQFDDDQRRARCGARRTLTTARAERAFQTDLPPASQ